MSPPRIRVSVLPPFSPEDDPLFGQPRLQNLLGKPKPVRESQVEKHLVDRIKALGGEVRKVTWQGRRGAPDRLVLLPARENGAMHWQRKSPARAVWIELKRPGEVPEPHQQREHERMRSFGMTVLVIDSKELVDHYFPLN